MIDDIERILTCCQCCHEEVEERVDKADQETDHVQCLHTVMRSEARKSYEIAYKDEIELNKRFRCFVSNFKLAYEGENTRKKQVDQKSTKDVGKIC